MLEVKSTSKLDLCQSHKERDSGLWNVTQRSIRRVLGPKPLCRPPQAPVLGSRSEGEAERTAPQLPSAEPMSKRGARVQTQEHDYCFEPWPSALMCIHDGDKARLWENRRFTLWLICTLMGWPFHKAERQEKIGWPWPWPWPCFENHSRGKRKSRGVSFVRCYWLFSKSTFRDSTVSVVIWFRKYPLF